MNNAKSLGFSQRALAHAPYIIFSLLTLYVLLTKIILIAGLAYTSDLFNSVQSAKSLLQGRPLFFANDLGLASYSHNFFLLILLSPFVWLFGAYSLIIITVSLFALAGFFILSHAKHLPSNNSRALLYALAFTFACGPIAFWLLDDPLYGWHIEVLYIPLSLLFVRALCLKSQISWLWAALIILCKEDGAVVACCLHFSVVSLRTPTDTDHLGTLLSKDSLVGLSKVFAFWLLLFMAGMALLSTFGPSGNSRLAGSWELLSVPLQNPSFRNVTLGMLKDAGLLIGASLIVLYPLFSVRTLLIMAVVLMPCLLVNYISAAIYAVNVKGFAAHGITWPARFSLLWSVISGVILCQGMLSSDRSSEVIKYFGLRIAALVVGCWILQSLCLGSTLDYSFLRRFTVAFHGSRDVLPSAKLSSAERSLIKCLAKLLPTTSAVATEPMLFGYFHNHDVSGADSDGSAWSKPEVIICERRGRLAMTDYCSTMLKQVDGHGFETYRFAGIEVGYKAPFKTSAIACFNRAKTVGN